MNPWDVKNEYALWRLITPLFLTFGFQQYVSNSFFLLIFGYIFQGSQLSLAKQFLFYFVVGFSGYLFACTCDNEGFIIVGCQPAICGLLGGLFALLIRNFKALSALESMRFCILAIILFLFLMILLYSMPAWTVHTNYFKPVDPLSQVGGFLSGIFTGLILMPTVRNKA